RESWAASASTKARMRAHLIIVRGAFKWPFGRPGTDRTAQANFGQKAPEIHGSLSGRPGTDRTASEFPAKSAGNPWQSCQSPEGAYGRLTRTAARPPDPPRWPGARGCSTPGTQFRPGARLPPL